MSLRAHRLEPWQRFNNVNEHFIERQDSSTELCRMRKGSLTELNRGSDLDRFADPPQRARVLCL